MEELKGYIALKFAFSVIKDFHSLHHAMDMALMEEQSIISNILGQPETRSNLWLALQIICLLLQFARDFVSNTDCGEGDVSFSSVLLFCCLWQINDRDGK